jgi:imidazoleglycerol phosphate dehydratase HisB
VVGSQQLASHGLFDVYVMAKGDLHIDDHHTNEDIALALGSVRFEVVPQSIFRSDLFYNVKMHR